MTTLGINQCKICTKRKFNPSVGLICGLTMEKPQFEGSCDEGDLDEKEALRLKRLEEEVAVEDDSEGFFKYEKKGMKKGVLGGVIMILIAIIWFIAGYSIGYIFYYPPILFIIGVIAIIKGVITGNIAGK